MNKNYSKSLVNYFYYDKRLIKIKTGQSHSLQMTQPQSLYFLRTIHFYRTFLFMHLYKISNSPRLQFFFTFNFQFMQLIKKLWLSSHLFITPFRYYQSNYYFLHNNVLPIHCLSKLLCFNVFCCKAYIFNIFLVNLSCPMYWVRLSFILPQFE